MFIRSTLELTSSLNEPFKTNMLIQNHLFTSDSPKSKSDFFHLMIQKAALVELDSIQNKQ